MLLPVQECLSVVAKSYAGITGGNIVVILEAMLLDNIAHVCTCIQHHLSVLQTHIERERE